MEAAAKCSKCNEELDTEGTPKWCKACRAKYQKEYQATKEGKAEAAGFALGAEAMRQEVVNSFAKVPAGGLMMAGEIAAYVAGLPAPKAE